MVFFSKRDKGEAKSFAYQQDYSVGPDGKPRPAVSEDLDVAIRLILADVFDSAAEHLEREAQEAHRRSQTIFEAEAFGTIVSGS